MLRQLVNRTARGFGYAVLIDCHSMPSSSISLEETCKADIVLCDRYGTSCAGVLTDLVESTLRARGYSVVRNKPYAGGFITEHYGQPALGRHGLQIEVNRALYMDERMVSRGPTFDELKHGLGAAFAVVMQEVEGDLGPRQIAAE